MKGKVKEMKGKSEGKGGEVMEMKGGKVKEKGKSEDNCKGNGRKWGQK